MAFTEEEAAYLQSQPLARIATVGPDGQPDVAPVGFEFDGTYLYVGGRAPTSGPGSSSTSRRARPRSRWSSTTWYPPTRGRRAACGSTDWPS